jgi:hypothetical protein
MKSGKDILNAFAGFICRCTFSPAELHFGRNMLYICFEFLIQCMLTNTCYHNNLYHHFGKGLYECWMI